MKLFASIVSLFIIGAATAQNPTILQGNYITNVFGNSNFVLNPNAQTNTANVAVSNATVTRSTTTPLVATSEFNITTSTATGYADWATRTFDQGMKNQNCEARFTYRGFSVGSTTVQIRQGSNTVAQLTLTASTDPRIASINFPCGDLSSATTLRVQQATASLTGTNEIGGLYLGLATNQANVAQAELVVKARVTTNQALTSTATDVIFNTEDLDVYGEFNTTTGVFTARRAGNYMINAQLGTTYGTWNNSEYFEIQLVKNTTSISSNYNMVEAAVGTRQFVSANANSVALAVGDTIRVKALETSGASYLLDGGVPANYLEIYRFPTSSELVVTPERQNTFGAASWPVGNTGGIYAFSTTSTTAQTVTASGFASGSATYYGAASASGTTNAFGMKVANIPPGVYRVSAQVSVHNQSAGYDCSAELHDDGGRIGAIASSIMNNSWANGQKNIVTIYRVTSFQSSREFLIKLRSDNAATTCSVNNGNGGVFNPSIVFEPLDQPSNSALYVQGPVLGAQTGAAIPAGYLGETVTGSTFSVYNASSTLGTMSDITGLSISLSPGVWKITGKVGILETCWTSGGDLGYTSIALRTGSTTVEKVSIGSWGNPASTTFYPAKCLYNGGTVSYIVSPTTTTSYKLSVTSEAWSGTPAFTTTVRSDVLGSTIFATRLN
jgi:hypothetical protein